MTNEASCSPAGEASSILKKFVVGVCIMADRNSGGSQAVPDSRRRADLDRAHVVSSKFRGGFYRLDVCSYLSVEQRPSALTIRPASHAGWNGPNSKRAGHPLDPRPRTLVYRHHSALAGLEHALCCFEGGAQHGIARLSRFATHD